MRKWIVGILLIILVGIGFVLRHVPQSAKATAADNFTWVQHQPSSSTGNVVGVAVDQVTPTTIYILTATGGVYKSTNSGTSWTAKNSGLPADLTVHSTGYGNLLTMDPNDSNTLYLNIGGVPYKTTNGATSWSSIGNGISVCDPTQVTGVIVDPTNSNHIFAAHISAGCSGGIFESSNQGSTWAQIAGEGVGTGIGNDAWTLATDPTNNQKLYIGTIHGVTAYSTDGGHNWTKNLPTGAGENSLTIAVHPTTTSRILLGNLSGLFLSADGAQTWTSLVSQIPYSITDIKFAPSNSSIGYITSANGIYKSTDGGLNWTSIGQASISPVGVAIDPADPTLIYIATSSLGVYRSTNSGTDVTAINSGLPTSSNIQSLAQSNSNADLLLAGAYQNGSAVGYKSTDRGFTWSLLGAATGTAFTAYGFNIHPTNPDIVYARIHNGTAYKFLKSINGGTTWSDTGITITSGFGSSTISRATPSAILVVDLDGYMHRSDDSGATWTTPASFNPGHTQPNSISNDVEFASSSPQIAFASSYQSVWKSVDAGVTWTQLTNGIPQGGGSNWINYVTIDPTNANIVYAVSRDNNIYKTTDGGDNWSSVYAFGSAPGKVRIDVDTPTTLYVNQGGALRKSIDSGVSWTAISTSGTFESGTINGVIQDLADHSRFLISGTVKGVTAYENSIPVYSSSRLSSADDNGNPLQSGDTQTFTVNVTNSGYGTSTNTNVVVSLFRDYSYRSGTAKVDGVAVSNPESSNTLTIPVGTLTRNQSVSVTFQVGFNSWACSSHYPQGVNITSTQDSSGTSLSSIDSESAGCPGPTSATSTGPSCSEEPPNSAPDLFQIKTYKNRATLFFSPPGGSYSNFAVLYGLKENDWRYSTQFNRSRSPGVISFDINSLAPNTTYYFKVRGGNGCAPGSWSNVLKVKTTTGKATKIFNRWVPPPKVGKTSKAK